MSMLESAWARCSGRAWPKEPGRPNLLWVAIAVMALAAHLPQRAVAQTCSTTSFPYTLTNGTTADASQVMANLNCAAIYGLANWGGNVGIGTTSPGAPLDVNGDGRFVSPGVGTTGGVVIRDNTSNSGAYLQFTNNAITSQYAYIQGLTPGGLALMGGNVGIGTASPGFKLEVNGALGVDGDLTVNRNPIYLAGLGDCNHCTGNGLETYTITGASTTDGETYNFWQFFDIYNRINSKSALFIDGSNGNIGIGTTSPSVKLQVEGPMSMDGNAIYFREGATDPNDFVRWNSTADSLDVAGWTGINLGYTAFTGSYTPTLTVNYGNVGIGTTSPGYMLQVGCGVSACAENNGQVAIGQAGPGIENRTMVLGYDSSCNFGFFDNGSSAAQFSINYNAPANSMYINPNGYVGIGTTSPTYLLYVNGQAGGATSWTNASDERLKKNVVEITGALQLVEQLRGVRFDWKSADERTVGKTLDLPQGEHEVGFIAQEVAKVVPEAVATPKDKDSPYGVKEADLVPLLVQAIKEQQQEIEKLQSTVSALQQALSKPSPSH
jgi:hypothetical protein